MRRLMLVFALFCWAAAQGWSAGPNWTGTWKLEGKPWFTGVLKAVDEGGQVRFFWEADNGKRASGAEGVVEIRDGKGAFRTHPCGTLVLHFSFTGEKVTLRQEGGGLDCGFADGVDADGTYRRISKARPVLK